MSDSLIDDLLSFADGMLKFIIANGGLIAALSLIISIYSLLYTRKLWHHTLTRYEQGIMPQLDVMLEDGEWSFGKPLMLHVTNLGESSASNVRVRVGAKRHDATETDDEARIGWVNFNSQPFSLLTAQSSEARKSIDVSGDLLFFLLYTSNVLDHSSQHKHGVMLKSDAEDVITIIRIECKWIPGVYKLKTQQMLTKYYCLRAWKVEPYLLFDNDHLQWHISRYDIENRRPTSVW